MILKAFLSVWNLIRAKWISCHRPRDDSFLCRFIVKHTDSHSFIESPVNCTCMHWIPSIVYALLAEFCLLIFSGKTMPWYLSMAMQVIVRMPVTMAVVCTNGTVLQTRTPAERNEGQSRQRELAVVRIRADPLRFFLEMDTSNLAPERSCRYEKCKVWWCLAHSYCKSNLLKCHGVRKTNTV